ncbi:MAG: LPXTG cell wall anchor domain-containing protein [bacterium]|nr:LPXTG cell wall anchor domain-containing protein [bacterium]
MHQVRIEARDFDGTLVPVGASVPSGTELRFVADELVLNDFNTAEFLVQSEGFDVWDVLRSSDPYGVAVTPFRVFLPGEYVVTVFARDLANQNSLHASAPVGFTVSGSGPEVLSKKINPFLVGAGILAVVGTGLVLMTRRK